MATATLSDSYWLSQSTVFKNRVQVALLTYCNTVTNETPTGPTGTMPTATHQLRRQQVANIVNPGSFTSWLTQFTDLAAADGNVIAAATQASTTYSPITTAAGGDTAAADGQTPLVTTTLILNAIAAAFNSTVQGL